MKRRDTALEEFLKDDGEFYGATLATGWRAPESVELLGGGRLKIRSALSYWSHGKPGRLVQPPRGLLDSFLQLAGYPTGMTLAAMVDGYSPSDDKICALARRYGGLQIFCESTRVAEWPVREHVESCEVWRYFARSMAALLRIAAAFYRGAAGAADD